MLKNIYSQFIYDYKMIFLMRLGLRAYLRLILVKVFLLVTLWFVINTFKENHLVKWFLEESPTKWLFINHSKWFSRFLKVILKKIYQTLNFCRKTLFLALRNTFSTFQNHSQMGSKFN